MEYVAGQTLRDIIRAEAPMAPTQAIDIAADIAAGLAAAHGEGIIHRDVKPANVLIAAGVAKVADFGIARAADGRGDLTSPGAVIGTATYLSPEQAQGLAVDQRSDLYSLGMVLYEMLTGRAPFRADSAGSVAYKQQRETPPPPSTDNPAVPPQLDAVVGRAMSFDPADRQGSAEELRGELLAVGHGCRGSTERSCRVGRSRACHGDAPARPGRRWWLGRWFPGPEGDGAWGLPPPASYGRGLGGRAPRRPHRGRRGIQLRWQRGDDRAAGRRPACCRCHGGAASGGTEIAGHRPEPARRSRSGPRPDACRRGPGRPQHHGFAGRTDREDPHQGALGCNH